MQTEAVKSEGRNKVYKAKIIKANRPTRGFTKTGNRQVTL